jgi:MFS family permease
LTLIDFLYTSLPVTFLLASPLVGWLTDKYASMKCVFVVVQYVSDQNYLALRARTSFIALGLAISTIFTPLLYYAKALPLFIILM